MLRKPLCPTAPLFGKHAAALDGVHTGGNVWVDLITLWDGSCLAIGPDVIDLLPNRDYFDNPGYADDPMYGRRIERGAVEDFGTHVITTRPDGSVHSVPKYNAGNFQNFASGGLITHPVTVCRTVGNDSKVVFGCDTVGEAESFIAGCEAFEPTVVHDGCYGIDANEEIMAAYMHNKGEPTNDLLREVADTLEAAQHTAQDAVDQWHITRGYELLVDVKRYLHEGPLLDFVEKYKTPPEVVPTPAAAIESLISILERLGNCTSAESETIEAARRTLGGL